MPASPTRQTGSFEGDCSPVEEKTLVQDRSTAEDEPPQLQFFIPSDPTPPEFADELCFSPSQMSSAARSIAGGATGPAPSVYSSATSAGEDEPSDLSKMPCRCPFIAATQIMDAAKQRALQHLKAHAIKRTDEHGHQTPLVRNWMFDIISTRMDDAHVAAIQQLQKTMKEVLGSNWPMHHLSEINVIQPGHVQPWMQALLHRSSITAAHEAIFLISKREGTTLIPFPINIPSSNHPFTYLNLGLRHHPCACKAAHVSSITSRILEESMTQLSSFITTVAWCSEPRQPRAALHKEIANQIDAAMGQALHDTLVAIADPEDIRCLCTPMVMQHVEPWMTARMKKVCRETALAQCKIVRWNARDRLLAWVETWLRELYKVDKEEEKEVGMEKGAGEDKEAQATAGAKDVMEERVRQEKQATASAKQHNSDEILKDAAVEDQEEQPTASAEEEM